MTTPTTRPARAHHRHHRPGRLVPGRAPARQGLRGDRHGRGAPRTVTFERIAHLQDDIEIVSGDLLDEASMIQLLGTHRPDEVYNLAAQSFVQTCSASRCSPARPPASASPASSTPSGWPTRRSASTRRRSSEMFGKVVEVPQTRGDAVLPRGRPTAWPRSTATGSRSTTARATACTPSSGILFNHESPRRGLEFVTRKIVVQRGQDRPRHAGRAPPRQPRRPARLGLRRRLRRGHVAACSSRTSPTTSWSPPARPTRSGSSASWPSATSAWTRRTTSSSTSASSAPPRSTCSSATPPRPARSSAGSRARRSTSWST